MRGIKLLFLSVLLFCSGCVSIQYNFCGEGIPPKKAESDIKRLFKDCSILADTNLGDKFRRYYAAYAYGKDAEQQAKQNVVERIRRDIIGSRKISFPLYGLEHFKHFHYNKHYWGIWFIPTSEYNLLKNKY